jgi:hypothetical protein
MDPKSARAIVEQVVGAAMQNMKGESSTLRIKVESEVECKDPPFSQNALISSVIIARR